MTEIDTLKEEVNTLTKRLEQYQQAYHSLQCQLQDFRRHRFGQKSERFIDPENPQLSLLDNQAAPLKTTADDDAETKTVPAHKRRKTIKKETANLPREIQIIHVPDDEKICACGRCKQVIRYETKELIHFKPSQLYVLEQRREVVACKNGCEQSIQTALAPKQILPKARATEHLLAHTIVSKLHHRMPLYHLEKYTELAGLSRETMARWHINLVEPLQPMFNLLKDEIIHYDIAALDATTLQVLKEPGRAAQTKSYLYCFRGGTPEHPVVLYDYNAAAHKPFVDNWFEGFRGSIHMDADPWFDLLLLDEHVFAAKCNAHARRKFEAIVKQTKGNKGLAYEAVGFYRTLYKVEKKSKQDKLSSEQRYEHRLKESKPILCQFKRWLDEHYPHVLPISPLGKAFAYCLNHWNDLIHFLSDGRLEIDNNLTEQAIKPIVIARKNFMFANSVNGAKALAMHFSLIRTALANNLNPYQYYVTLLKRIPFCETVEDYVSLLPWNVQLEK